MADNRLPDEVTRASRAVSLLMGLAGGATAVGIIAVLVRAWRGDFG